jgi:hypothetical protein
VKVFLFYPGLINQFIICRLAFISVEGSFVIKLVSYTYEITGASPDVLYRILMAKLAPTSEDRDRVYLMQCPGFGHVSLRADDVTRRGCDSRWVQVSLSLTDVSEELMSLRRPSASWCGSTFVISYWTAAKYLQSGETAGR